MTTPTSDTVFIESLTARERQVAEAVVARIDQPANCRGIRHQRRNGQAPPRLHLRQIGPAWACRARDPRHPDARGLEANQGVYAARELTLAARTASTKVKPRARAFRKVVINALRRRNIGSSTTIGRLHTFHRIRSSRRRSSLSICAAPVDIRQERGDALCRMSTILTALAVLAATTPGLLVSPADSRSALKDPATVVLAVGNSADDFDRRAHSGRAVRRATTRSPSTPTASASELPPVDQLRAVFARRRRQRQSKVVIYGSAIRRDAAVLHARLSRPPEREVLNGGLKAWKANGGAVEIGAGGRRLRRSSPVSAVTPKPQPERVASAPTGSRSGLSSPKMTLLDARPDAEFTGADGGMSGTHVMGHLPGAQQLVWNTLLDRRGKLPARRRAAKKFEAIGATHGHAGRQLLHGRHARVGHLLRRAPPRLRREACTTARSSTGPGASCRP